MAIVTTSIRVDKSLVQKVKLLAEKSRPRSTIQYVVEDAIEEYLNRQETTQLVYPISSSLRKVAERKSQWDSSKAGAK